ncbi:ceramide phosphoethanolamine synthase [Anthonomus grandis grandis]|uniref:ceramide phosphoethanolamine synthase n=1 Tax=Anthonomus grandis grandis TaxID=2921223 RepID=UPI0021656DBF|nr:ceramide phosphoethanolamine synthase [Anthonomus grandis grandis]XP_050295348.1 ceramide phosphoethanolamine synthase [Anthonomus grandis grandis]XP_050295357.1 ceramide phosphoethanolamine synthase [Anthonomus grandis grandis]XP_050295362.1 ceramide phosphoethanolamine synthase [Anthonomus grandis grandis]
MMGPSSQISKVLVTLLFITLLYYSYMDYNLYVRIQNYPIESNPSLSNTTSRTPYKAVTWVPCNINPLCDVTVKALLLDHTNYYLFAPLVTIMDNLIHISDIKFLTPNVISFSHVFIAIMSAKCISSDNLAYRRMGVVLFEIRTWMDDLDGHVARVRKHIKGERSEVGTSGYYIDGLCDALGCIALILGIVVFFRNNPPRRGYMQLPTEQTKDGLYCGKVGMKKVLKKLGFFVLQLIISSAAWNRYIAVFQDLLENETVTGGLEYERQNEILTSSFFYCICWLWRVVNIHNMLHFLLLAVFCDKLWEVLSYIQYLGFGILFTVICVTELYYIEARNFVFSCLDDTNKV